MTVIVYIKPACGPCRMTCLRLDDAGVDYGVVDISQDDEARDYVMALGYLQAAPVVAVGDRWSGLRPGSVESIKMGAVA